MALAVHGALAYIPEFNGVLGRITQVAAPIGVGMAPYLTAFRLSGGRELSMLMAGKTELR